MFGPSPANPGLRLELLERLARDQAMRTAPAGVPASAGPAWLVFDTDSTALLRRIWRDHG